MDLAVFNIVQLFMSALIELITRYGQSRALPMRRRVLFLAIAIVSELFYTVFLNTGLVAYGTQIYSIIWVAYELLGWLIWPFVFWQAKLRHKVLASAACLLPLLLSEIFCGLLWSVATGLPVGRSISFEAAPMTFIFMQCIEAGIVSLVAIFLAPVFCRWATAERAEATSVQERIAWFLPLQVLMLAGLLACLLDRGYYEVPLLAGLLVLALFNLGADAILLATILHTRRQAEAAARVAALEQSLDACLASYEELSAGAAAAARVRHDERNHAQILAQLVKEGELQRARAYLGQLPDPQEVRR